MPLNSLKCAGSAQFSYFYTRHHPYASAQEAKEHGDDLKLAYHTFGIGTRYHYGMAASRRLAGVLQTTVFHDVNKRIIVLSNMGFISNAFPIKRIYPTTSGGRPCNGTGWTITFLGNVIRPKICGFIAFKRIMSIRIWFGLCTCFVFQTNVMLVKILI